MEGHGETRFPIEEAQGTGLAWDARHVPLSGIEVPSCRHRSIHNARYTQRGNARKLVPARLSQLASSRPLACRLSLASSQRAGTPYDVGRTLERQWERNNIDVATCNIVESSQCTDYVLNAGVTRLVIRPIPG